LLGQLELAILAGAADQEVAGVEQEIGDRYRNRSHLHTLEAGASQPAPEVDPFIAPDMARGHVLDAPPVHAGGHPDDDRPTRPDQLNDTGGESCVVLDVLHDHQAQDEVEA